jgi:hypothetical protein
MGIPSVKFVDLLCMWAQTLMNNFSVLKVARAFIVIADREGADFKSVTENPSAVVRGIHTFVANLSDRKIYYRDFAGEFCEMKNVFGYFAGFEACSDSCRLFLKQLIR